MRLLICLAIVLFTLSPLYAEEQFKDVPKDHWAAESVQKVAEAGIMNGYPDNTFQGDKSITRYELAVVLANLIYHLNNSEKPINNESAIVPDGLKNWGGDKLVTQEELAKSLAKIVVEVIEERVPSTQSEQ